MANTEYLARDLGLFAVPTVESTVEPRSSLGNWIRHVDYYKYPPPFSPLPMASSASAGADAGAIDGVVVVVAVVAAVPG